MNPFLKWLDEHFTGIFLTFFFFPVIYGLFWVVLFLLENFFNIPFLPEIINFLTSFSPSHKHEVILYFLLYYLLCFLFLYLVDQIIILHKENLKIKKKSLSTSVDFDLLRLFLDKKKEILKKMETEQDTNNLIMLKVLSDHLENNIENIIKSGGHYKFTSNNFFEYRWNREENKYTKFNVGWNFICEETKKESDEQYSNALSHHEYLGKIHLERDLIEPDSDEELSQWEIDELHLTDSQLEYFFFRLPIDDDLLKLYYDAVFLTEARSVKESITGYHIDGFYIYNNTYTLLEEMKKAVIRENKIR